MSAVRWLVDLLLSWLGRRQRETDQARAEAMVEEARRMAVRDRADADARAIDAANPQAELRRRWRRGARLVVLVALVPSLSACGEKPAQVRVIDTGCDWVRPLLIEPADNLTDRTARGILAHNETWERRCK